MVEEVWWVGAGGGGEDGCDGGHGCLGQGSFFLIDLQLEWSVGGLFVAGMEV